MKIFEDNDIENCSRKLMDYINKKILAKSFSLVDIGVTFQRSQYFVPQLFLLNEIILNKKEIRYNPVMIVSLDQFDCMSLVFTVDN